jgi:hypothetical protein
MSDWQPIDTAPKDGTRVLLYDRFCREPEHARFVGVWWGQGMPPRWVSCPGAFSKRPTHWRPLPEPPG